VLALRPLPCCCSRRAFIEPFALSLPAAALAIRRLKIFDWLAPSAVWTRVPDLQRPLPRAVHQSAGADHTERMHLLPNCQVTTDASPAALEARAATRRRRHAGGPGCPALHGGSPMPETCVTAPARAAHIRCSWCGARRTRGRRGHCQWRGTALGADARIVLAGSAARALARSGECLAERPSRGDLQLHRSSSKSRGSTAKAS
jgi:hypothetical protein